MRKRFTITFTSAAICVAAMLAVYCSEFDLSNPVDPQSWGGQFNSKITYGEFIDERDKKKYKTVTIGSQTWMAENLNFDTADGTGSWCYNGNSSYCNAYGRLYTWNVAMSACPAGWSLPTDAEWTALENAVGGSSTAGTKLKSQRGWGRYGNDGNGTDDYGFSALPGGYRLTDGSFYNAGNYGHWWTATENDGSYAYSRYMYYDLQYVGRRYYGKDVGYSIRCRRD